LKQYRIIACDMDGTLLNSDSKISKENLVAIERLADMGIHFVPTSGRTYCEIPKELIDNPKIRYIIGSNGAAVFDKHSDKRILTCLDKEKALKVYDILAKYGAYVSFRYDGKVFADSSQQSSDTLDYLNVCAPHRECIKMAVLKENLREFVSGIDYVEVFATFFHSNAQRDKCNLEIIELGNLKTVNTWDCNLEIFNAEAGKGSALIKLAESIGVEISDTIAVGDSENDISMIETAGLGLAMGNSVESIKQIADEVICDNDSHAIDYILKEYFDEKNKYIMF